MSGSDSTDSLSVFERWYAAHESRDTAALAAVLSDDVQVKSLFRAKAASGREAAIAHFLGVNETFSDLSMSLTCAPAVTRDRVLVEVVFSGAFTGELAWQGTVHAGNGRAFEVPGVAVIRIEDGQVCSVQTLFDRDAWLSQVGIDPVPAVRAAH
ncbi:nuclear transport factor 2 family protein [Amycolatopsis pigmentata]|uniref:Nuclear transport factor 2 family protein n=1 Tax=Amycolatopsis pigmentata TaxID=450801 RepID=A0ABW5FJF6_9PSEU